MIKCSKEKLIEVILLVMIAIFAIITVLRSFYTIDITDESYIYADALLMLKGNVPYALNASEACGMSFLTLPFVFLYNLVVPDNAGIVLFLRISFSILRLIVVFFIYRILKRKNETIPCLLVSLLLTVWYYFTNYFSYNSNAIWILILVSVWLYDLYDSEPIKVSFVQLFFAGFLSAFAVFSHPFAAISVALFVILLFSFAKKGEKIRYTLIYCAGGLFVAFSVLIVIVVKTSFFRFYSGLRILSLVVKQVESFDKFIVWKEFALCYGLLYAVIAFCFLCGIVFSKRTVIRQKTEFASCLALAGGTIYISLHFLSTGYDLVQLGCYFGSMGIFLSLILGIAKKEKLFLFMSLPFFLFVMLELSAYRNGTSLLHPNLAFPTLLAVVLVTAKSEDALSRWIVGIVVVAISSQLLYADVVHSYRDDPVATLDTRVESGVYKGLITSNERAKCLPEMEEWIANETEDCDSVIFRDNAPFAYLMYKGHTPELQAWDILNYSTGYRDNAKIMYNNFKNHGEYPKRIIYIDYGYDEYLSIDTDFQFNEWVNAYYDFVKEEQLNTMFRVKVYDYNGTFDGDYSKWTNF